MTTDKPQSESAPTVNVMRTPGPAEAVTGVHLMQGIGHQPAKGFWADAWSRVIKRPGPVLGLTWLGIIIFFAAFAPFIASGHPIVMWEYKADTDVWERSSPMLNYLSPTDILIAIGTIIWAAVVLLPMKAPRSRRLTVLFMCSIQAGLIAVLCAAVKSVFRAPDASDWHKAVSITPEFPWIVAGIVASVVTIIVGLLPFTDSIFRRVAMVAAVDRKSVV